MRLPSVRSAGIRKFLVVATVVALVAVVPALAQSKGLTRAPNVPATPFTDIMSGGPLTDIFLGNELSAQIAHTGDSDYEVFPPETTPGDYGTFLLIGGVLYSPDFEGHGSTATGGLGSYTAHTPVSQSGVTGSGTSGDPYQVVTTATVGATGITVTQTDSYVVGDEFYRTDMVFTNNTGSTVNAILYRAMDCYLGGSDSGYGFVTGSAVGCSVNANNTPPGRVEQLVPITPGNAYYEAGYSQVWSAIGAHAAFNNTCRCSENIDNGAGVSWNISIPPTVEGPNVPTQGVTVSHYTVFSPTGIVAVSTTKTADQAQSQPGATNGYTISFHNPNTDPVTLTSILDTLPAGFTYVAGSSSGATTTDPTINGQNLTWSGSFVIPASGDLSLHFQVHVASTPDTYYNQAGGEAQRFAVAPTGPTAPIQVLGATSEPIPTLGTLGLIGLAVLLAIGGALAIMRLRS
jgi:uncharacterized repeat protein (TIGR01451 family)